MLTPFRSKKAEVLNHWIAFAEEFQCAPSEFYQSVEKEILARRIPGLEMTRIDFAEGGALSDKRVYLRMLRERLVFDVCAAPFGTAGSFFSCRVAEIPAVVKFWQLALVVLGLLVLLGAAVRYIGFFLGPLVLLGCVVALIYVLRNAVAMGLSDLDAALIKTPVLGPIYEAWFRKETYYRLDTRLMYVETVGTLVRQLAEEATAAKGVKLVRQFELAPVLGDLYKPAQPLNRSTRES